jgi:hypothetical protein
MPAAANPFKQVKVPKPYQPSREATLREAKVVPQVDLPGNQKAAQEEAWRKWQSEHPGKGSASILEFIIYEYITKQKGLKEGTDFVYQWSLAGGRTQAGGFVADFYFPSRHMVWNPAGLQFHYTKTKDRWRDQLSRVVLANRGIKEIFLWEDDLVQRPQYTLDHAWLGQEVGWRFKPS